VPDADEAFVDFIAAKIGEIDVVDQILVDVVDKDARLFMDSGKNARHLLRRPHDRKDLVALRRQAVVQDVEGPGDVGVGQDVQQCRRQVVRLQQVRELFLNVAIVLESLDQADREGDIPQGLPIVAVLQDIDDFVRQYRRLVAGTVEDGRERKAAIVVLLQGHAFQLQDQCLPESLRRHQGVGGQVQVGQKLFDFSRPEQHRALGAAQVPELGQLLRVFDPCRHPGLPQKSIFAAPCPKSGDGENKRTSSNLGGAKAASS